MHAYDAQNVTFHLMSTDTPLHYHTPNISLCVELHFNICDCHPSAKEGEWDDSSPINLNLEMFAKTASCSCSCHKLLAQDFLQNLPALWNCPLLTKFILKSPWNPAAIPVNITHVCVTTKAQQFWLISLNLEPDPETLCFWASRSLSQELL